MWTPRLRQRPENKVAGVDVVNGDLVLRRQDGSRVEFSGGGAGSSGLIGKFLEVTTEDPQPTLPYTPYDPEIGAGGFSDAIPFSAFTGAEGSDFWDTDGEAVVFDPTYQTLKNTVDGLYMVEWAFSWAANPGVVNGDVLVRFYDHSRDDESTSFGYEQMPNPFNLTPPALGWTTAEGLQSFGEDLSQPGGWSGWAIASLPANRHVHMHMIDSTNSDPDRVAILVDYPTLKMTRLA